MKIATGEYFNMFTEKGYENYGIDKVLDIYVIFAESFDALTPEMTARLETLISEKLKVYATESYSYLKKRYNEETVLHNLKTDVYLIVQDVLLALDCEYAKICVDVLNAIV